MEISDVVLVAVTRSDALQEGETIGRAKELARATAW